MVVTEKATGKKNKVRLLGVDTPEIDFNGFSQGEAAQRARDYLRSLIPLNAEVIIKPQEKSMDSNGRTLGQIFYQGQDINSLMLKAGWGALYFIYPFEKKLVADYIKASGEAYQNNRGLFSSSYQQVALPYIFRQEMKGVPGNNLVGDFSTKRLNQDISAIPAYRRVFFSSENIALTQGYHW